jgi:hypothetical protein
LRVSPNGMGSRLSRWGSRAVHTLVSQHGASSAGCDSAGTDILRCSMTSSDDDQRPRN